MARTRALFALLTLLWPLSASATKITGVEWISRDDGYSVAMPSKLLYPKSTIYSLVFSYQSAQTVVPWPAWSQETIKLAIHLADDYQPSSKLAVEVTSTVNGQKHRFTQLKPAPKQVGEKMVIAELGTAAQLQALLGFTVNKNLLVVSVTDDAGKTLKADPLYIVEQHAVVLLPGVLATEIHINGVKRWPEPMQTASKMIDELRSDAEGRPLKPASKLQVIEQPVVGGPYHIATAQKWLNEGLPVLKMRIPGDEHHEETIEDVPLVYVQEYPYDWGYKPEVVIDTLLGPKKDLQDLAQRPAYSSAEQPSLRTIQAVLKKKLPFLGDKLAVAGHSTGGLILNGLVRRPAAAQIVSHAFFIATPFFGVPKAYYTFLMGSMKLGAVESLVLGQDVMRTIGVNLAVLYYLAPSRFYPGAVAHVSMAEKGPEYAYYRAPAPTTTTSSTSSASTSSTSDHFFGVAPGMSGDSAPLIDKIIGLRSGHHEDSAVRAWNPKLDKAADDYHQSCARDAVVIPGANVKVFYSDYPSQVCNDPMNGDYDELPCTLGPIVYRDWKGSGRLTFQVVDGDQTVPTASLLGAWDKKQQVFISERVDHLGIVATTSLWHAMRDALMH